MATIKDIARALNISTSTVSYALNGGPRQVPEQVRERVVALARELGYKPNRLARSLVTGRSGALGVRATADHQLLQALVEEARTRGEDLLIMNLPDSDQPETLAFALLDGRIDGVAFLGEAPDAVVLEMLTEQEFPFVNLAAGGAGVSIRCSMAKGLAEALAHLSSLGHSRLASVFSPLDTERGAEQYEGFRSFCEANELERVPELLLEGPTTLEAGYQAGKRLLSLPSRPTAILASSDEVAFGIGKASREAGLDIPKDISIIGMGDLPISQAFQPPLSTIRIPHREMAAAALDALLKLCRATGTPESQTFDCQFLERGSTARPSRTPVALKKFDRGSLRGLS